MCQRSLSIALVAMALLSPTLPAAAQSPLVTLDSPPVLEESLLPNSAIIDSYSDIDAQEAAPSSAGSGCGCAHCRSGGHGAAAGVGACPPSVLSEAWCRRPLYVDAFFGAITGDEMQDELILQRTSFFGGLRLGHDLDANWAVEGRLGFSDLQLSNRQGPPEHRTGNLVLGDISLVHHFGHHRRVRPFLAAGVGLADWEFTDALGNEFTDTQVAVPISVGLQHRYDDWLVFRLDLTDNLVFGGGTISGTQHVVSITGGVELRFGGSRTSYWPWRSRTHFW